MFHNLVSLSSSPIGILLPLAYIGQKSTNPDTMSVLVGVAGVLGFFLSLGSVVYAIHKHYSKPRIISAEIYNGSLHETDPIGFLLVVTLLIHNVSNTNISLFSAELETEAFGKPCKLISAPVNSNRTFQIVPTFPGIRIPMLPEAIGTASPFPCAINSESTGLVALIFHSRTPTKLHEDIEQAFRRFRENIEITYRDPRYATEQLIIYKRDNRDNYEVPSVKVKGTIFTSSKNIRFNTSAQILVLTNSSNSLSPMG